MMGMKVLKLATSAQRSTRTVLDTIEVTPDLVRSWKLPPFQRPLRVNEKVQALAEFIKLDGGVIPGVLTLGVMGKETFLLDGQHRREAFLLSGCDEGYVDVRRCQFESLAEMGEEFVNLNARLVDMRPDDVLRGLEGSVEGLSLIRKKCPFVGYDQIRRGDKAPVVSMSAVLRSWRGSAPECPAGAGASAATLAKTLTADEASEIAEFLGLIFEAWGRDSVNARLWGTLNLTLTMWMYRRLVVTPYSATTPKLTKAQFSKCLMSVAAADVYVDWLLGRGLKERDRAPAYSRLKGLFAHRIEIDTGKKPRLPQPAWATSR